MVGIEDPVRPEVGYCGCVSSGLVPASTESLCDLWYDSIPYLKGNW